MPEVPTRFPKGVSTADHKTFFGMYPKPQDVQCNYYFNDFNTYAAADWTVTTVNSGTSALEVMNGGALLITTGATDTNYQGNTLVPASFAIDSGYQAWFLTRIKVSSTTASSWVVGLTNGGPSAPTDGIYFTKATNTTAISLVVRASSTSTTKTTVTSMTAATWLTLGWYYNGSSNEPAIDVFSSYGMTSAAYTPMPKFGGQQVYRQTTLTNIPVVATVCAPQFYLVTTSGSAARTMEVDYVLCAVEMSRF